MGEVVTLFNVLQLEAHKLKQNGTVYVPTFLINRTVVFRAFFLIFRFVILFLAAVNENASYTMFTGNAWGTCHNQLMHNM